MTTWKAVARNRLCGLLSGNEPRQRRTLERCAVAAGIDKRNALAGAVVNLRCAVTKRVYGRDGSSGIVEDRSGDLGVGIFHFGLLAGAIVTEGRSVREWIDRRDQPACIVISLFKPNEHSKPNRITTITSCG